MRDFYCIICTLKAVVFVREGRQLSGARVAQLLTPLGDSEGKIFENKKKSDNDVQHRAHEVARAAVVGGVPELQYITKTHTCYPIRTPYHSHYCCSSTDTRPHEGPGQLMSPYLT